MDQGLEQAVRAFKKRFVERAPEGADGEHNAAAKRLGVNARYLYHLIKDLDAEEP